MDARDDKNHPWRKSLLRIGLWISGIGLLLAMVGGPMSASQSNVSALGTFLHSSGLVVMLAGLVTVMVAFRVPQLVRIFSAARPSIPFQFPSSRPMSRSIPVEAHGKPDRLGSISNPAFSESGRMPDRFELPQAASEGSMSETPVSEISPIRLGVWLGALLFAGLVSSLLPPGIFMFAYSLTQLAMLTTFAIVAVYDRKVLQTFAIGGLTGAMSNFAINNVMLSVVLSSGYGATTTRYGDMMVRNLVVQFAAWIVPIMLGVLAIFLRTVLTEPPKFYRPQSRE